MGSWKRAVLGAGVALLCVACSYNVSYKVVAGETPRAEFGTPYVLAIADWKDSRKQESSNEEMLEGALHRRLKDKELAYLADLPDALAKHLAYAGLFKGVVREGARERAHLVLSGEILSFRIAARVDFLERAKAAAEAATPDKPAPLVTIPVRSHLAVRLTLWRVDKKAPVWTGQNVQQNARAYRSFDLGELTNLAFKDAMNNLVAQLAQAVAPHRSGPPHPPPRVEP